MPIHVTESVVALGATVVSLGALYRYLVRPPLRWAKLLRDRVAEIHTQSWKLGRIDEMFAKVDRLSGDLHQLAGSIVVQVISVQDRTRDIERDVTELGNRLDVVEVDQIELWGLLGRHGIDRRNEGETP